MCAPPVRRPAPSIDPEKMKAFAAVVGALQALLKQALNPHAQPEHTMSAMMLGPMMKDLTTQLAAALGSKGLGGLQLPKKPG